MYNKVYVIGHMNPDTDSIASAIGYAWFLSEKERKHYEPARTGVINPQTSWLLKLVQIDVPVLLTDASPRFEAVMKKIKPITRKEPLRNAWKIASKTTNIVPIINQDKTPFGCVTGESIFKLMVDLSGAEEKRQTIRVDEIMNLPCERAADKNIPKFTYSARIKDYIKKILWEERNVFIVINEKGKYVGIANQKDLLNPPRIKLILVDHNETNQSIPALDEAELLEILDHHRLGNSPTQLPIRFLIEPVGSTCTLVTEKIINERMSIPEKIAVILISGIISDTLNLISPTTTQRDKDSFDYLSKLIFKKSGLYPDETVNSFAHSLLSSGTDLNSRSLEEIIESDIKVYSEGEYKFAIAQAEVTNFYEADKLIKDIKRELMKLRQRRGLDFVGLMVTDVVRGTSRLIFENIPAIMEDLPFDRRNDGTWQSEGLVSRKKQLVPVIFGLIKG